MNTFASSYTFFLFITLPLTTRVEAATFAKVEPTNQECYDAFKFQTGEGTACPPDVPYDDPCKVMAQWRDYFTDLTVLESCCYCGDRGGYRNGTLTGMNVKAGVPRSSTAGFALYEDATSGYLNGSIVTFVTDFACAHGLGIEDVEIEYLGLTPQTEELSDYQLCLQMLTVTSYEDDNNNSIDMCIGEYTQI